MELLGLVVLIAALVVCVCTLSTKEIEPEPEGSEAVRLELLRQELIKRGF